VVRDAVHRDQLDHDPRGRRWCRCFVDIFSCRPFEQDAAAAIAVARFGGTPTVTVLER
jgi:hypothetical protein